MKSKITLTSLAAALLVAGTAHAQTSVTGPSSSAAPYAVGLQSYLTTYSVLTAGNTIGGYSMVGIPDGLGAFDNGNGTFTMLMNQELGTTQGVTRAHGSVGAFVSMWTIDKNNLQVTSGSDLIQTVKLWNTGTSSYDTFNSGSPMSAGFNRFCSADLAPVSAFSSGSLGTTERLFLNGEEGGATGRAFAHIATGTNAGTSYELPALGNFSWENAVANPFAQTKTIVVGTDDDSTGNAGVYVYVGNKTSTGTEIEKAGLTGGSLFGIKVGDGSIQNEVRATEFGIGSGSAAFSMVNLGNVTALDGTALNTASVTGGVSAFLRPEDAAWDTLTGNKLYFVTTDRYDQVKDGTGSQVGRSRLWEADFTDIANPENGGSIKLLLDGTEAGNMFDNLTVDGDGNILLQEDVGGQAHNGKLWSYNPTTDALTLRAKHDPSKNGYIGLAATAPFNNDEEFSGIIDITSLMSSSTISPDAAQGKWYAMVDQQHYTSGVSTAQVEGGQLLVVHAVPEPSRALLALIGFGTMLFRRRRA